MFPKTGRIKNKALLKTYHAKRCLVCNRLGCDPCHIKTVGSGGSDEPYNVINLCRIHHSEQHQIGIMTFLEKYPAVQMYLRAHGWQFDIIFGRNRLIRPEL